MFLRFKKITKLEVLIVCMIEETVTLSKLFAIISNKVYLIPFFCYSFVISHDKKRKKKILPNLGFF